jgi:type II secretory pathway pseudopilin PulG
MVEYLKKQNKILSNDSGIGLVEALIAVALSIILIVSLLTLTNFNIRNSLLITENQDAINSANLLLENLRSIKDSNFANFVDSVSSKCINSNCTVNFANNIEPVTIDLDAQSPISYFKIKKVSDNEIQINIMTEWKVGNSIFSSPLSTIFTNWRSK